TRTQGRVGVYYVAARSVRSSHSLSPFRGSLRRQATWSVVRLSSLANVSARGFHWPFLASRRAFRIVLSSTFALFAISKADRLVDARNASTLARERVM